VDEAQFLDDGIVDLANRLATGGSASFSRAPTSTSGACRSSDADPHVRRRVVDKFQAICVVCGGPATGINGLVNGKPASGTVRSLWLGGARAMGPGVDTVPCS